MVSVAVAIPWCADADCADWDSSRYSDHSKCRVSFHFLKRIYGVLSPILVLDIDNVNDKLGSTE
jgi:hypothetical protein